MFTERDSFPVHSDRVFIEPLVATTNDYLWPQLEITYYPIIVSRIVPVSSLEQEAAAVKGN